MTSAIDRLIEADLKEPKRIAVIGDAMTDVYVYGEESECQDSCKKFVEKSRVSVPGGAANARRQLQSWPGARPCLFGPTWLASAVVKTRFMVGDKCVYRYDQDGDRHDPCLDAAGEESLEQLRTFAPHAVLISDYDKGALTPALVARVIELAHELGVPCVADAKREPELYRGALLKCNFAYATRHKGMTVCPAPYVITCGDSSPYVVTNRTEYGQEWVVPKKLLAVRCVNHVGAGDCFAAHLAFALAHGLELVDAAAVAHSAGRVYVQHRHNRPPRPEEIREGMRMTQEEIPF